MKKKDRERIKMIKFHYDDSEDFELYELDEQGRIKNLKMRAQRTNYKKLEKGKKKASVPRKKEDYPSKEVAKEYHHSEEMAKLDYPSEEMFREYNPYEEIANEYYYIYQNSNLFLEKEIKIDDNFFEKAYCDKVEPFYISLSMGQENYNSFKLSFDEIDGIANNNL